MHFDDPNGARTVRVRALRPQQELVDEAERSAAGYELVQVLELLPDEWHRIEAIVDGAHLPPQQVRLAAGDYHGIEFFCRGTATRLHIGGPSRALAPYLHLSLVDLAQERPWPYTLPLTADGSVTCRIAGEFRAGIALGRNAIVPLADGHGRVDLTPVAGTLELTPTEPVVGIVAMHESEIVPAAIRFEEPHAESELFACSVHTAARADAATAVHVRTRELGCYRGPVDLLPKNGDLWPVDLERLTALGELAVHFDSTAMPARIPHLRAVPHGGGEAVSLGRSRSAMLPAGDYRLVWEHLERTAVEFVRVPAGETVSVEVTPTSLERWKFVLREAPKKLALNVRYGGLHSYSYSDNGTFQIDIGKAPRVGDEATVVVFFFQTMFPATVVAVDTTQRRAELESTLHRAQWTRLTAVPLRGGPLEFGLLAAPSCHSVDKLANGARVPMLPATKRNGYVIETIDGQPQLTRWFDFVARGQDVTVTPHGRWATLQFARATPSVRILCVGPTGTAVPVGIQPTADEMPFYVAEGTTAVSIEAPPLAAQTFDPGLSLFVVR